MKPEKRQEDRNEVLSKLYSRFMRDTYNNSIFPSNKALKDFHFEKYGEKFVLKDKNNKRYVQFISSIITAYYQEVLRQGICNLNGIYLVHLGLVSIAEVNPVNGKPRLVSDGKKGFIEVIQDMFTKTTKYVCTFKTSLLIHVKSDLHEVVTCKVTRKVRSKLLRQAYAEYPEGKFFKYK